RRRVTRWTGLRWRWRRTDHMGRAGPATDAVRAEMARLRDRGLTLTEIGRRLGVSRSFVWTTLARSGYVLPASARRPRGFAALDPERHRALARKGGRAAARNRRGGWGRGRPADEGRRAEAV